MTTMAVSICMRRLSTTAPARVASSRIVAIALVSRCRMKSMYRSVAAKS